jgi:hypothetical protein
MTNERRPEELNGTTYKLKWVGELGDETYYVTINNREVKGKILPWEMFFNSQHVTHYPWMVALARMISAVFQRGEKVAFVASELQEVFDPSGSLTVNGVHYRSLLDMIGKVLELHMISIGYIAINTKVEIDITELLEEAREGDGIKDPVVITAIGEAALAVEKIDPTDDDFDVRGL